MMDFNESDIEPIDAERAEMIRLDQEWAAQQQAAYDAKKRQSQENAKSAPVRAVRPPGIHRYELMQDISLVPTVRDWIIKGIIASGETTAWIAPPGGMKSALMADMAISVASGRPWRGMKNTLDQDNEDHSKLVVYFALERADLVKRRLKAHVARLGIVEPLPIAVVSNMVDLTKPEGVQMVIKTVRFIEDECDQVAVVLIFDTMAKVVAAGGLDEDKAQHQGIVFANLERVQKELCKPHIAIVGHTGKDASRGARGSSAFLGHADAMIEISGDTVKTATVTKANDIPMEPIFSFTSEVHEFGVDEDGDPITVNIVSAEDPGTQIPVKREPRLSANEKALFGILHDAGQRGLSQEEWYAAAKAEGIGSNRPATLTNAKASLKSKGLVRQWGDRWQVVQP